MRPLCSRSGRPQVATPVIDRFLIHIGCAVLYLREFQASGNSTNNQSKNMEYGTIKLTDVDMLHKVFRGFRSHDGVGWLFRGHAQASWELLPKAGRPEFYLPDNRDLGRFHNWTKSAVAYTSLSSSYLEQLALAQHHGLATRLLDWSMNPLVACYFACSDHADRDGAIWMYEMGDTLMTDQITQDTLKGCHGVFGYIPKAAFPRIINQKGLFTVHCDAAHAIGVKESRLGNGDPNLICLHIPANLKPDIVKLLADYGIDRTHLFPDLDGLSAHINAATARMRKPGSGD